MMEAKGIRVLEFEFTEAEVSEMSTDGEIVEERDETAFKQRLEVLLLEHGIADDMS